MPRRASVAEVWWDGFEEGLEKGWEEVWAASGIVVVEEIAKGSSVVAVADPSAIALEDDAAAGDGGRRCVV